MRGKIKAYSEDVNAGVITGEDGKVYGFAVNEWIEGKKPVPDQSVSFTGYQRMASKVSAEE